MKNRFGNKNRVNKLIVLLLALLYMLLHTASGFLSSTGNNMLWGVASITGVITAVQFVTAMFMTVTDCELGGRLAVAGIILTLMGMIGHVIRTRDFSPLPGMFYCVAGLIAVFMIRQGLRKEITMSCTDPLTGISNRRDIINHINYMVLEKKPFYLLYLDLDHFKYINDTEGHEKGDAILISIVDRWEMINSYGSHLGRIGGDEFLCIVPKTPDMDIEALAVGYLDALEESEFGVGKSAKYITASIGIAEFPKDGKNAKEIISRADIAMYSAKHSGRNTCLAYREEFEGMALREQNVEKRLQEGLKKESFYVVYQPQFMVSNRKLRGFEALVRLEDRGGEHLSPAEFIPIAEKSSLIMDIGDFVMERAMTEMKPLADYAPDIVLSINISARQLKQGGFVDKVDNLLKKTGYPANRLEFEITESSILEATDTIINIIEQIKSMGIRLALDDFGVGYSSLSYLIRLPFDTIKIDKSIVDSISRIEIIRAIISMGHALGCKLISEGVEMDNQLEVLADMGCDYVQGFIWGRPEPIDKVVSRVTESRSI